MQVQLADKILYLNSKDHLPFQWMLQTLLKEKPSFAWFKAKMNNEKVYIFTRHQKYLNKRWPCLFIMGKGWSKPITICDKIDWQASYDQLKKLELDKAIQDEFS